MKTVITRRYTRAVPLVAAGLAVTLLGACSSGSDSSTESAETAAETTTEVVENEVVENEVVESDAAPASSDDCTYYWLAANITNPFYVEGKKGWDDAAAALGVNAELVGPLDADVTQQVSQLDQMIAQADATCGILLYAIDYNAMGPVLQRVKEAGIPVINGNGDSEDKSIRDAFVGTDNAALGRAGASLACEALGGKGKVGIVSFITAQNHQERVAGFQEGVAANCPDVEILPVSPNDGTAEGAFAAANGLLTANPDVALIWATDAGSPGVARAVEERGVQGKVIVVGTDRTPEQIDAIKRGTVAATITQDTEAEEWVALHYLKWLRDGKAVPEVTITEAKVINADNVDSL